MYRAAFACCTALALVLGAGAAHGQAVLGVVPAQSIHPKDSAKTAPLNLVLEYLARTSQPLTDRIAQGQDLINGLPPQGRHPGLRTYPTTPMLTIVLYEWSLGYRRCS